MRSRLIRQVLTPALLLAVTASGHASQKPVVTKTFHGSSRAAFSMASSIDELWRLSDTVIEGVIEGDRPANHVAGDAEIAHTMYVVRVIEVFKANPSRPIGQTILIRRVGGTVEKPDVIEVHERSDEPRLRAKDRIIAFLKQSTVNLPPPNDQQFYVGTSLDSPDSFVKVDTGKSASHGKSVAAREMSQMSAPDLRADLRRRGGGR
jgi:hypothetical protein